MFTVIAGTNRPDSNTLKVSRLVKNLFHDADEQVTLLDLTHLPGDLFSPFSYATKPEAFQPFQQAVLDAEGILSVVPEYNGSFPGVMKYFVDMLRFPDSLVDKPAAFVGLSSGRWGAVRAVEQLEMVFQYRCAHLYGRQVFLPEIGTLFDDGGHLNDEAAAGRLRDMVTGFIAFCHRLAAQ
jgi:NAD(P)H-dependent FMN reductase